MPLLRVRWDAGTRAHDEGIASGNNAAEKNYRVGSTQVAVQALTQPVLLMNP
jgi:hypothetical protein